MKKAVAWSAIFLVVAIFLSIIGTAIVFWNWWSSANKQATMYSCQMKLRYYCTQLIAGKNPDWNDIEPKTGCEKYGIVAPPSKEDCGKMGLI